MKENLKLGLKENWKQFTDATFIELANDQDPNELQMAMVPYKELQNKDADAWKIQGFELFNLDGLAQGITIR